MGFRVTVEAPLFFAFFGFLLVYSIDTNLIIYRTCYVGLGFNKSECALLGKDTSNATRRIEKLVQPKADIIAMAKSTVDSLSGALLCLFVGAWSDRFGRKPIMVLNLIGYTLMMLVMAVFSALENLSPWYMLACSIPVILTGGGPSFLTVLLASLTDITSEEQRGFRMGLFESVMATAVLTGSLASSYVLNATNYVTVYLVGALSCFVALLYTIFFISESLETRETENKIGGLFKTSNLSGMFETTFRIRPHHNRSVILLIMFALALYFVAVAGDGSVMFLFMREKFQWTLKKYTWYNSATDVMWIFGTVLIVYILHHRLKVKESVLMLAGFLSLTTGHITQGCANVDWLIYLASVIQIPSSGLSPMTRTLMSKLVNENEVAKIFSVFNITSSLIGLVGAPAYTTLYNATLDTNPGIFHFVTAATHGVASLCIMTVLMLQCRTNAEVYSVVDDEDSETNSEEIRNSANQTVCDSK